MNKLIKPIYVILILFIAFSLTHCGGSKQTEQATNEESSAQTDDEALQESTSDSRVRLIELQVNTVEINETTSKKKWKFIGQDENQPDSLFTTNVKPGDVIVWVGVSSDSINHKVKITNIKHVWGKKLLTDNEIMGMDSKGIVISEISKDAKPGDVEKYELRFKVLKNGEEVTVEIPIDPKLRI